jgi:CO/xanthine dehydrogenase FAD-binding subunit
MQSLRYEAPTSVTEAVEILAAANGRAAILAGGTDLLVRMHAGAEQPGAVVNVKKIPELRALELGPRGLVLGAAVCAAEIGEHTTLAEVYPGLAEAVALIGSDQIQGRASVGGNLCNGSPAADTVPSLVALGAECEIAAPGGQRRRVAAHAFVTGPGRTVLRPGELLVALHVPRPAPGSADAYLRFIPRSEMDIAVVGAAVSLTLDGAGRCSAARVALGAVAPTVVSASEAAAALVGSALDEAALTRAGDAARAACNPIDDKRGTAGYRRKIAAVLTRRAAALAAERARRRS